MLSALFRCSSHDTPLTAWFPLIPVRDAFRILYGRHVWPGTNGLAPDAITLFTAAALTVKDGICITSWRTRWFRRCAGLSGLHAPEF